MSTPRFLCSLVLLCACTSADPSNIADARPERDARISADAPNGQDANRPDARVSTTDATALADDADDRDDASPSCGTGRATADRPDDSIEYQVHVIYMIPSDGTDRALDTNGTLATSTAAFSQWMATQSGGPRLRLDTCGGALDITFFQSSKSDATIAARGAFVRNELETELEAAGFDLATKLYAVYYDGTSTYACGGGAWPPALVGKVAAMYLRGLPDGPVPCINNSFASDADSPGYLEFAMLHEIVHTLGFVATCAPNHTRSGHSSDSPTDLMYAGDQAWRPSVLDVGGDDYWNHKQAGCADLAESAFLAPTPAAAVLPPGWPN